MKVINIFGKCSNYIMSSFVIYIDISMKTRADNLILRQDASFFYVENLPMKRPEGVLHS